LDGWSKIIGALLELVSHPSDHAPAIWPKKVAAKPLWGKMEVLSDSVWGVRWLTNHAGVPQVNREKDIACGHQDDTIFRPCGADYTSSGIYSHQWESKERSTGGSIRPLVEKDSRGGRPEFPSHLSPVHRRGA